MPDDLDELLTTPARPGPKDCHVCWSLARMDDDTADKMRAVLARTDLPWQKVSAAIERRTAVAPGQDSIRRHRQRCAA